MTRYIHIAITKSKSGGFNVVIGNENTSGIKLHLDNLVELGAVVQDYL